MILSNLQKVCYHLFKFLLNFVIFTSVIIIFSSNLYSNDKIVIEGNVNIPNNTILSFASPDISISDPQEINLFQKKLFDTGFFKFVDIKILNEKIYLKLEENPLVNFFYLEGIKSNELKTNIEKIIKIRENSVFNETIIKNDIKIISEFLNSLGYLANIVEYEIYRIKSNKLNIFYKIKLNNEFKIKNIFFIGDKFFKSSTLRDVIYSSEHGWWKFFSSTSKPSEEIINYDISRLKNFYLSKGFYDIQINSQSIKINNENYADLIYSINSGKKYSIKSILIQDFSNSLKIENKKNIQKIYNDILKDVFYNKKLIETKINSIRNYLSKSNFNLITNYEISKINDENLTIAIKISEPPKKKIINKIEISGNIFTEEFVIRNFLKFSEGEIFIQNKISSAVEKIKGSSLFKEVNYYIKDLNDNEVDIFIKVLEAPSGEIAAGAGAGTSGASISTSINEKNFLGKGVKLNGIISVGTEKVNGRVSYSDPDFKNSGNLINASIYATKNTFDGASYENKVIGSGLSTKYEIFDQFFLNPGIAIDFDSVKANDDASESIKRRDGNYFTSKFTYNLLKDTKNREFNPTSGFLIGFGQGYSIFSDIPYINNKIFGSYHNEYNDGYVGTIRYRLETINSLNSENIKYSDRLFVNENSLRGFASRGIGPKISSDYIGGNYLYFSSFSTSFPNGMPDKWNMISNIFFDNANVWGTDDNESKDYNKIRSSVGLGLSWISPLGPISMSYAEPLTKSDADSLEQFSFRIGSAF